MFQGTGFWRKAVVWCLILSLNSGPVGPLPASHIEAYVPIVDRGSIVLSQETSNDSFGTAASETAVRSIPSDELEAITSNADESREVGFEIVEAKPSGLPEPFMLAQATQLPTPSPLPSVSSLDSPVTALQKLEDANELLTQGELAEASLEYLDTLDKFPRTEASVYAYRRLADLSAKAIRGEIAASETQEFIAGLPTWKEASSAESKYILLGLSYTLAAQAKEAGDENLARQYFSVVAQQSATFLAEHPADPLQIFAARHYEEAARELGGEAQTEFLNNLESVVRNNEAGPANWSARAVLAHHYFTQVDDAGESSVHRASMIDDWELAGLDDILADAGVYDSVKAWYVYYLGHALFALGFEKDSITYFDLVLEEFKEAGPVRELAGFHKAFAIHSLNGHDPYVGIQAYQEFIDAFPESEHAAKAMLRMARIYILAEDYDYAIDVLQEAKLASKKDEDGNAATASIDFLNSYVIGTQKVSSNVSSEQLAQACGPVSLHYLLASIGVDSNVDDLIVAAGTTETGTSMQGLVEAAAKDGVVLDGVRAKLPSDLPTPFIAFIRDTHFVLVLEADRNHVVFRDLHRQPKRVASEEFVRDWHGEALVLRSKMPTVTQLAQVDLDSLVGGDGGDPDVLPSDQDEECPNRRPFYWYCRDRHVVVTAGFGFPSMSGSGTGVPDAHGTGSREHVILPSVRGVGMPMDPLSSGSRGIDIGIETEGVHAIFHAGTRSIEMLETDIAISTVGNLELNLTRGYSSPFGKHLGERLDTSKPYKNNIGSGWVHGFNAYIRNSSQFGTLVLYRDGMTSEYYYKTGQQVFGLDIYKRDETVGSLATGMTADKGIVLYRNPNTGTIEAHFPGGHFYNFSPSVNSVSRLLSVKDAKGNTITLEYNSTAWDTARLLKVKTPPVDGRYIEFTYNGSNLITRASLKKPSTPSDVTLQFVDYVYGTETDGGPTNENHYLKKVEFNDLASVSYDYRCAVLGGVQKAHITQITDRSGQAYFFDWVLPEEFPTQAPKITVTTPDGMRTNYIRDTTSGANNIIPYLPNGQPAGRITQYFPNPQGSGVEKRRFFTTYPQYEEWNYGYVVNRHDLVSVTPPGSSTPLASYEYTPEGRVAAVHSGSLTAPAATWSYNTGAIYPYKMTHPELGDTLYDYFDAFGQSLQLERVDEPFFDDFNDKDYNRWTVGPGSWNASTKAMQNTLDGVNVSQFKINQASPNPTIRFKYRAETATTSSHYLRIIGRQNSTTRLEANFRPDGVLIRQFDGTNWSTLSQNLTATTVQGQWYDVTMKYNGASFEIWRAKEGETQTLITSTTSATITTASQFLVEVRPGAVFSVDDLQIISPLLKSIKTYAYDSHGQVSTITLNSTTTTYTWDAKGNLASVAIPGDGTTSYLYDDLNNITKITTPDSLVRDFLYTDPLHPNKVTEIHYSDSRPDEFFVYAPDGELEVSANEDLTKWRLYDFDTQGRVTRKLDGNGDSMTVMYDTLGRPKQIDFDNLGTYTYEYDHMNRVKRRVNYLGIAQNYTYTHLGALASVTLDSSQSLPFHESENPTTLVGRQVSAESSQPTNVKGAAVDFRLLFWCIFTFCPADMDDDGISNCRDNCMGTPNPDQADRDGDGIGDVCERDTDGDTIVNGSDNCPYVPNQSQADTDSDGVGDACDNCRYHPNPDQSDSDGDRIGDTCEYSGDIDNDGVGDSTDNCRNIPNADQADEDNDGVGDVCDNLWDRDGDGIQNEDDNCPDMPNPDQADWNSDGIGDACDPLNDIDRDGIDNWDDNCPNAYNPTQADADSDGIGDACDTGGGGVYPCIVRNEGFESGTSEWVSVHKPDYGIIGSGNGQDAVPATGSKFAWFGSTPGVNDRSSLSQDISISDATTAILKFKLRTGGGSSGGPQYFRVLANDIELFKIFQQDPDYTSTTTYEDVHLDLSSFAGGPVRLKLEAFASSAGFLVDDLCITRYGTEAGGNYTFRLNSVEPQRATAGANQPVLLTGTFGIEGTDYDNGSLKVRIATKGRRYEPATDPVVLPIINKTTDKVEISVPNVTPGSVHVYLSATRDQGASTILTNLVPFTVEPLTFILNYANRERLSKNGGETIILGGDFTENDGAVSVLFTPQGGSAVAGTSVTLRPDKKAISVTTPSVTISGGQQAGAIHVTGYNGSNQLISNAVDVLFFTPTTPLDPDGDCSSELIIDGHFEGGGFGYWTQSQPDLIWNRAAHPLVDADAYRGNWFAWLGDAQTAGAQSIVQSVYIPETTGGSGAGPATLQLQLWINEYSGNGSDRIEVRLDGNVLATIYEGNSAYRPAYAPLTVDVSQYADNATHSLEIRATVSPATTTTDFFIDDVSIRTGTNCIDNWGIDALPSQLHFGYVPINQSLTKVVSIENIGTTPLIGQAFLESPFEVIGDPSYNIPPGHSQNISIKYEPTGTQMEHSVAVFTGGGNTQVHLFGTSIELATANRRGVVALNQILADNQTGLRDGDGDFSDWIQLRNFSDYPVNLAGWTLAYTPSGGSKTTWTFPATLISARGYLVVFASGKSATLIDGGLHTNFTLNSAGGTLEFRDASASLLPQSPLTHNTLGTDQAYSYVDPTLKTNRPATSLIPYQSGTWALSNSASPFENPFPSLSTCVEFIWRLSMQAADGPPPLVRVSGVDEPLDIEHVNFWLNDVEDLLDTDDDGALGNRDRSCCVDVQPVLLPMGWFEHPTWMNSARFKSIQSTGDADKVAANSSQDIVFIDKDARVHNVGGFSTNSVSQPEKFPSAIFTGPRRVIVLFMHYHNNNAMVYETASWILAHELGHFSGMGNMGRNKPMQYHADDYLDINDSAPKQLSGGAPAEFLVNPYHDRLMNSGQYTATNGYRWGTMISPKDRRMLRGGWSFPNTNSASGWENPYKYDAVSGN